MTVTINNVAINDVLHLYFNECEVSIIFNENHGYVSIEAIEERLNDAGLSLGNYHFNHKNCYGNDSDYGTDVLCVIPENVRKDFTIWCRE